MQSQSVEMMLKIVHINQSDLSGGAAIAAWRMHETLLAHSYDSRLVVGEKAGDDERVGTVPRWPLAERILYQFGCRLGLNYVHHVGTFALIHHPFFMAADVIHLHNLHRDYFSYLALPRLIREKPAVYTLHDMWGFTGHCTYSYDCSRWQTGCGRCPYPDEYPAIRRDGTRIEWLLKKLVYRRTPLRIITPSRWLAGLAQRSILGDFPVTHIPNGIDTDAYAPLDRERCRWLLGIPSGRKVLLCAAEDLSDRRKGADLLVRALLCLPDSLRHELLLVTFGSRPQGLDASGLDTLHLGSVYNPRLHSILYSAADAFVFPTRQDNLPLVLQESMACGTPLVSFAVGGVSELVRPDITGYLAEPEDHRSFAACIEKMMIDDEARLIMGQNCRKIATQEYSNNLCIDRYLQEYKMALADRTL